MGCGASNPASVADAATANETAPAPAENETEPQLHLVYDMKAAMAQISAINKADYTKKEPADIRKGLQGTPLKPDSKLTQVSKFRAHGGLLYRFEHKSECLSVPAQKFGVFVPDEVKGSLLCLNGAKGEDDDFPNKVGALMFKVASGDN